MVSPLKSPGRSSDKPQQIPEGKGPHKHLNHGKCFSPNCAFSGNQNWFDIVDGSEVVPAALAEVPTELPVAVRGSAPWRYCYASEE